MAQSITTHSVNTYWSLHAIFGTVTITNAVWLLAT